MREEQKAMKLSKEGCRWIIWTVVLIALIWMGINLIHLKHLEWFLLLFTIGCVVLVFAFRHLRVKGGENDS